MAEKERNLYRQKPEFDMSKVGGEYRSYYTMRLNLTNFFGARIEQCEDEDGNLEEGVFIPLSKNDLKKTPKGNVSAYAYVNKIMFADPKYDWTHLIRLKMSASFAQKMKELGYKSPYLGNIRLTENVRKKAAASADYKKYIENYGKDSK